MHPCCNNQRQTKPVTLTFKRSELVYDAENYSFVEGDIMKADDEHARHQVFDIAQKGNIDRVTRVLNLAHAECVEMLYPYTKEEVADEESVLDDVLTAPEEYNIVLNLPREFSLTTVQLLKHIIHEYLVCRVLADWMSITNPSSQSNWGAKLDNIQEQIRGHLNARCGRVRRTQTPF